MLLEITALVDARGLTGPTPVSRAKQVLAVLEPGAVIEVLVTGPAASSELARWCAAVGHEVVEEISDGHVDRLVIRRK